MVIRVGLIVTIDRQYRHHAFVEEAHVVGTERVVAVSDPKSIAVVVKTGACQVLHHGVCPIVRLEVDSTPVRSILVLEVWALIELLPT